MEPKIKLLEERVTKVVGRLRELSAERNQLENELRSLRERVESVDRDSSTAATEGGEDWGVQKAAVVDAIRRTLDEFREA